MGLKSVAAIAGLFFVGYIAVTGFDDPVYVVDRVVDGDTIKVVEDGTSGIITVRLLNVDMPEMVSNDPIERCYSKEAKAFLEDMLPPDFLHRPSGDAACMRLVPAGAQGPFEPV